MRDDAGAGLGEDAVGGGVAEDLGEGGCAEGDEGGEGGERDGGCEGDVLREGEVEDGVEGGGFVVLAGGRELVCGWMDGCCEVWERVRTYFFGEGGEHLSGALD